jgi:hypothetical protein
VGPPPVVIFLLEILSCEYDGFKVLLLFAIYGYEISPLVLFAIGSSFLGGLLRELLGKSVEIFLNDANGFFSCNITILLSSIRL